MLTLRWSAKDQQSNSIEEPTTCCSRCRSWGQLKTFGRRFNSCVVKKINTEQNFRNILGPINPNNDLNTKVSGNWKKNYSQNGVFRVWCFYSDIISIPHYISAWNLFPNRNFSGLTSNQILHLSKNPWDLRVRWGVVALFSTRVWNIVFDAWNVSTNLFGASPDVRNFLFICFSVRRESSRLLWRPQLA
jgi:hypothetical protein